jgi:hypothetical protein
MTPLVLRKGPLKISRSPQSTSAIRCAKQVDGLVEWYGADWTFVFQAAR